MPNTAPPSGDPPDTAPAAAPTKSYDLYDTLSHLLRRSHFQSEALYTKVVGGHGVTSRQLALLVAIRSTPGASQRSLGETIALDMNSVSDLLRRMEARGLIDRRRSAADGRTVTNWLTAKGEQVLGDIWDDNARYQQELTRHLSREETHRLKALLLKLLDIQRG